MNDIKLPKIHVNAEFQRLWWTNVHWGLVLGVVLAFGLFLSTKNEYSSWNKHFITVGGIGMALSSLAGYILLERSLKQDISANAFDQLRMSALSVWQMAWSRIVVAPLLAWLLFALSWASFCLGEKLAVGTTWHDVSIMLALPFLAWGVACVILANALPHTRDQRLWQGSLVQLILLYIAGTTWLIHWNQTLRDVSIKNDDIFNDLYFQIFHPASSTNMASTFVISAIMASVFVWARMANVLHLRRVDKIYAVLAVLSPVLFWWMFAYAQLAAAMATGVYGSLTLLSLATQSIEIKRFRLPVWVLTAPLGILVTVYLDVNMMLIWAHIVAFGLLVWVSSKMRFGVNAITVALATYLLGQILWGILS